MLELDVPNGWESAAPVAATIRRLNFFFPIFSHPIASPLLHPHPLTRLSATPPLLSPSARRSTLLSPERHVVQLRPRGLERRRHSAPGRVAAVRTHRAGARPHGAGCRCDNRGGGRNAVREWVRVRVPGACVRPPLIRRPVSAACRCRLRCRAGSGRVLLRPDDRARRRHAAKQTQVR